MKAKNKIVPLSEGKRYGLDHHIWNNNGTWWMHYSLERRRGRAKRVRISLHTHDRKEARIRRDAVMKTTPERAEVLRARWKKQQLG